MEKSKIWLMVIVGLVLLAPVGAVATTYTQTITDTTKVIPYQYLLPTTNYNGGNPLDVIASNPSLWDIKQVAVTWDTVANTVEMKIYTNYAPGGVESAGQGDIALTPAGSAPWGYGISMAGVNQLGNFTTSLVTVDTWLTTKQIPAPPWSGGGYYYAGAYVSLAQSYPIDSVINTWDSSLATTVNGSYTQLINDISTYLVDLKFNWVDTTEADFTSFDFLVKSGTCGNETMLGTATYIGTIPTPIPPSALLLGSGLVALVGLRWRRRQSS